MFVGDSSDERSVLNPNNYGLVGSSSGVVEIQNVTYDSRIQTAFLVTNSLPADTFEFTVSASAQSAEEISLAEPFTTSFTTASDLTSLVDIEFTNTRSSRTSESIAYDVAITNTGQHDLLLADVPGPVACRVFLWPNPLLNTNGSMMARSLSSWTLPARLLDQDRERRQQPS